MRTLLAILMLLITGCGGRSTPVVVPPLPPPTPVAVCEITARDAFTNMKVYTDNLGRSFCYDDTDAPGDATLLPVRWDSAAAQIKQLRPALDVESPIMLQSIVVKFKRTELVAWNGVHVFQIGGAELIGNFDPSSFPARIDIIPEAFNSLPESQGGFGHVEPLGRLQHENRHAILFFLNHLERCASDSSVFVWKQVGHGGPCDLLNELP